MPVNWPPAGVQWPPAGYTRLEALDVIAMELFLKEKGFTSANPTNPENNTFFANVRCDLNHPVVGRMLIAPDGSRYPFAACNTNHDAIAGIASRAVFFLWPPYYQNSFIA